MKLNYKEAEKYMHGDYPYPIGMDDIDRVTELKKILLKYTDEVDAEFTCEDYLITICPYPKGGIEEEDVIKIAKLMFSLDGAYIIIYGK
jgi:hypothetical protein